LTSKLSEFMSKVYTMA